MKINFFRDMVTEEHSDFNRDFIEFSFTAEICVNGKCYHIIGAYTIDAPMYSADYSQAYFHHMGILMNNHIVNLVYPPKFLVNALRKAL